MKWRFRLRQTPLPSDTCASIEPLLSLYSDGMASSDETGRVESHLSACDDCRRALVWMQATRQVISERPLALPPVDLRARIAQAIAEAEPSPLSVRTVRRPVVFRPALLAAAASLMVAGVFVEHSLLTSKRAVVAPPIRVASSPRSTPPVISQPLPSLPKTRTVQIAAKSPRRLPSATVDRLPETRPAVETKEARVPDASTADTPAIAAPIIKRAHSKAHAIPDAKPSLMASQPKTQPHSAGLKPRVINQSIMEAKNLPSKPLHQSGDNVVTPTPELATPPVAPIEAVQPKPTQVAVVVPAAPPTVHDDVLSNVRARLATFRAGNPVLKVYRDSHVRVQTAAYDTEAKFVLAPVTWTPTSLAGAK